MIIISWLYWIIVIILGAGAGAWVTVHIIVDYPPPEAVRKLGWLIPAGGLGGLVAGALFSGMASDPMPGRSIVGLAAVISLGLVASAIAAVGAGFARKQQAGR